MEDVKTTTNLVHEKEITIGVVKGYPTI